MSVVAKGKVKSWPIGTGIKLLGDVGGGENELE